MDPREPAWRRLAKAIVIAPALTLVFAGTALADTTIGQTAGTHGCSGGFVAADSGYQVPAGGGVITSFSYGDDGNNAGAQLDFEVLRANPDGSYTIVGDTGPQTLHGSDGVETFPAHILVSGGEILGYYETGIDNCLEMGTADQILNAYVGSDPGAGATLDGLAPFEGASINESANLAPPQTAAQLSAGGESVSGTEGQQLSGPVATFSDPDAQPVGDYAATIDWGDGSASAGTVSATSSGSYEVDGSHLYAEAGDYVTSVQISDVDGTSVQASGTAAIADAPLSATGKGTTSAPVLTTRDFIGPLATVDDANALGSKADLSATIDWGDGNSSQGTLSGSDGSYTVSGSHQYSVDGPETVQVHVTDVDGSSADATTQLLVYETADQNGRSFVVGDAAGSSVYFWGAQWAANNPLSGGAAPRAFKGFADASAQSCGGTFTASSGGSSHPPAAVPAYMAVAVTGALTKRGSAISGTVEKVEIVRTDSGYGPDPGHAGTGQVVATLCG